MIRRILHIHGKFHPSGGAETYLRDIRQAQTEMGCEVFTMHASSPPDDYVPVKNEYFTGESRGGLVINFTRKKEMMNLIRKIRPDVVHLHVVHYNISPYILRAIIRSYPTVYTVHDIQWLCARPFGAASLPRISTGGKMPCRACLERKFSPKLFKQADPRAILYDIARYWLLRELRRAAVVLAHNEPVKQVLIQNGFSSCAIKVIRPYLPVPDEWNETLSKGVSKGTGNSVLHVGGISAAKGVFDLVEALGMISDPDWKLVIAGDGDQRDELWRFVREKGLSGKVKIVGNVARGRLADYYRRADLVVMPSRCPETFGYVGLEAMLFGKPVIAWDSGIPYEWLINGKTGYLADCGNLLQLRDRIKDLMNSGDLAMTLGENARKYALKFLDRNRYIEKLDTMYRLSSFVFHNSDKPEQAFRKIPGM